MLNALSACRVGDHAARLRLVRSYELQGFRLSRSVSWQSEKGDMEALLWSHPAQASVADAIVEDDRGFACSIGTLWYKGLFGSAALSKLLEDFRGPDGMDEESLRGSFVALIRTSSGAWLFNDPMGFARVHVTDDELCFSTSWLAARAWVGTGEIDEAAVVEYVLTESVHGEGTPARGVSKLPIGGMADLVSCRVFRRFEADRWATGPSPPGFESAVDALYEHYRSVFSEIVSAFPGKINCALSGGFDSRMIVAALLDSGERPNLFVYGDPASADVDVARAVAASQGMPIRVVDKDEVDRTLAPPCVDTLTSSALFFDGLPNDGILDPGADRRTRLQQSADGSLALNGGGGEILRNFFHLPDRRLSAEDLVRTFYRGFDTAALRQPEALDRYVERLARSIEAAVGASGKLGRKRIELAYPLFRCHYWMASNNSVELRHGYFSTPLVDAEAVRIASRVSLDWKNAGRLQSALISALHSGIAAQQSAYGFSFSDGPGMRARLSEQLTCARPIWARPVINAMRRRLQHVGVSSSLLGHWRSQLPGEWRLDHFLDLTRLPDDNAFARALSVEVVHRCIAP